MKLNKQSPGVGRYLKKLLVPKFRWHVLCDQYGGKTEPELQFWNGKEWEYIEYVEEKVIKEDKR